MIFVWFIFQNQARQRRSAENRPADLGKSAELEGELRISPDGRDSKKEPFLHCAYLTLSLFILSRSKKLNFPVFNDNMILSQ